MYLFRVVLPNNIIFYSPSANTTCLMLHMLIFADLWYLIAVCDIGWLILVVVLVLEQKKTPIKSCKSRLRNVIERVFEKLKVHFFILKRMMPYPFRIQRDVIVACVVIYSFLLKMHFLNNLSVRLLNNQHRDVENWPTKVEEGEVGLRQSN